MTEVATRPELGEGILSHRNSLEIEDSLSFNDWRRLGERLLLTRERLSWSIGDWWAYGERFGRDYATAVTELEHSERSYSFATLREYARVAVAFPLRKEGAVAYRMPAELSFAHHHHVLSMPEPGERMRWLDEATRQGWSVAVLREELRVAHAVTTRVDVLDLRVMEETYRLACEAAERRRMDPRVWCIEAIREQAVREIPALVAGNGALTLAETGKSDVVPARRRRRTREPSAVSFEAVGVADVERDINRVEHTYTSSLKDMAGTALPRGASPLLATIDGTCAPQAGSCGPRSPARVA